MASAFIYSFGPFELDTRTRRLNRGGEYVAISDRHLGVLIELVANAGQVVSKDAVITAVWGDVAVTDNSLEQAVSWLRKLLGDDPDGHPYLETVSRRGYRFVAATARSVSRETDEALDELLAPHRAWIEGRAALETLERDRIDRARSAYERALALLPEQSTSHLGLANACVMQFETTRADPSPNTAALALAVQHAREACRLDPQSGEAWATLGFVLDRAGQHADALAAARRAVMLDSGNWRHHFRLSLVSWGDARLGAAHRTLALLPGFPLAHWVAATVHVARQAIDEAERELAAGVASDSRHDGGSSRFASVALHWLLGLIHLSRGESSRAFESFERELATEGTGQLYARECAANAWYAMAAAHWRDGRAEDTKAACHRALERIPTHPMAHVLLAKANGRDLGSDASALLNADPRPEAFIAKACGLVLRDEPEAAAALVDRALAEAPAGNAGWIIPVEPVLGVARNPGLWAPVLARLRLRAA